MYQVLAVRNSYAYARDARIGKTSKRHEKSLRQQQKKKKYNLIKKLQRLHKKPLKTKQRSPRTRRALF